MWGMLAMGSLVGLFLGFAVAALVRSWVASASALMVCCVAMIAFSGWLWPLSNMARPVQLIAAAMPSRWAFEGLLLLEVDARPGTSIPDGSRDQEHDLAEEFFPADSARMGPAAGAAALASMLIGLGALTVFISRPPWLAR